MLIRIENISKHIIGIAVNSCSTTSLNSTISRHTSGIVRIGPKQSITIDEKRLNSGQISNLLHKNNIKTYRIRPEEPVELPELPEVTTDGLSVSGTFCTINGTIISGSGITEYGFVYAANTETPTLENHKQIVGTEQFIGSFEDSIYLDYELDELSLTSGSNPVWFAVYATNDAGTAYGSVIQSDPNPWLCLIEGTLITLSNGSKKKIENITYEDMLLVWNFDEARFDEARPIWIVKPFKSQRYSLIKFSDGSELGTINDGKGHRMFNVENGMFTNMMGDDTLIGSSTQTDKGNTIKVINKEIVDKEISFYNIISNVHMNVYANGILTSTGLNNIYPINNMKFVTDDIINTHDLDGIPYELIVGLRLAEQKTNIKEKVFRMMKQQLPFKHSDTKLAPL